MSKRDRRRRKRQKKQDERRVPPERPERLEPLKGDLHKAALAGDLELFHSRLNQDALYEEGRRRRGRS